MKKVLAILLAALMLFSLAACSGSGNELALDYIYNEASNHKAIAEFLQSSLKTAGIDVTLKSQEWNTFLNTRKEGDYTIARNGWLADYDDPISFLDMWISESGNNDCQFGKGAHAKVAIYDLDMTPWGGKKIENGTWSQTYDVIIGMIKKETDNAKRLEMMHAAEDLLMSTGCITPLYYYTDPYMISKEVEGFYASSLGYKFFAQTTMKGKTALDICLASEPDTLDPALNSSVDGATMVSHLFSGLAKWGKGENGEAVLMADCAEELVEPVLNKDGTATYTYTLKEGLKWSNGKELKASDFVYSWNRAASVELAADYGYMFDVVKGYDEMTAVDKDGKCVNPDAKLAVTADDKARTITVTLKNMVAYWDQLLAFPTYFPVYKDAVQSEKWATSPETYVSNGAYTMSAWKHESMITLQKNPSYHDADIVTMPTLKCHLSDDDNNMLTNFKKDAWQMIDSVPIEQMDTLKAEFPDEFKIGGQMGTYYISWNINKDLGLKTEQERAEVRKAIGLLIDRNYLVKEVSKGGEQPASSFVAMGMADTDGQFYENAGDKEKNGYIGYYDVSEDSYQANAKKAVEILSKYYDGIETE